LSIPDELPILPLKDTVIYPFAVQPLGVGQERSIHLIDEVMRGNRLVVLVAQKSAEIEQAGPDDIFKIGTVSRIARMIRMPDGTIQIIVQGLNGWLLANLLRRNPILSPVTSPYIQEERKRNWRQTRNVAGTSSDSQPCAESA
jgi:ATP-dependent Lon protease